jgi:activator of HSP90 ATPase
MMENHFTLSVELPVDPERLYKAWLSSKEHSAFTGGAAKITARVAGKFSAWDGYISGRTLELEPYRRIVQAWRTTEFPEGADDSRLEIIIDPLEGGAKLTLIHTNLPEDSSEDYKQGWEEFYFAPMKAYFAQSATSQAV